MHPVHFFLGQSLEFAAFSLIFWKTSSYSAWFISGSCSCSRVAKTFSSNVSSMAWHCCLSHLHVFNPYLRLTSSPDYLRASVWAFFADFWDFSKTWLAWVQWVSVNNKIMFGALFLGQMSNAVLNLFDFSHL